jgi:hypothetical protein
MTTRAIRRGSLPLLAAGKDAGGEEGKGPEEFWAEETRLGGGFERKASRLRIGDSL